MTIYLSAYNVFLDYLSDYACAMIVRVVGVQNVYICEVGNKEMNGTFEQFSDTVINAAVQVVVQLYR